MALILTLLSRTQTDLHRQIELTIIGGHLRRHLPNRTVGLLDRRAEVDGLGDRYAHLRERSAGVRLAHVTSRQIDFGRLSAVVYFSDGTRRKRRLPNRLLDSVSSAHSRCRVYLLSEVNRAGLCPSLVPQTRADSTSTRATRLYR